MSAEAFLDTNVLVYAVSSSAEDAAKKDRAIELIEQVDFGLSAQVLQEFYVSVTRKIERPLAPDAAVEYLELFRCFPTVHTDYPLIVSGIEIALRYGISYWDGAIIAAAEFLDAEVLYTEDLSHGQIYGTVEVINPFMSGVDRVHDHRHNGYDGK